MVIDHKKSLEKVLKEDAEEKREVPIAEDSRGKVELLARLNDFEKHTVVQKVLKLHGINSANEIFADDDIFFAFVVDLEQMHLEDPVDPQLIQAFFEMAAKKCPWRVVECFDNALMDSIDPEVKMRLWESVLEDGEDQEMPAWRTEPEDDSWVEGYKPPETEEEMINSTYRLLVEPGHEDELPEEILELMALGGHETFSGAMENEEVFEIFKRSLKELKSKLSPEFYSHVLVVAAEQDGDVENFLKDYKVNSWHHAMQNHNIFKLFVTRAWLDYFRDNVKPAQLFHELLTVAAITSSENAQWLVDKARQDEAGETKLEGGYEEDSMYYYILQEILGKKVYKMIMKAAETKLAA